jgi:hypothetical protein
MPTKRQQANDTRDQKTVSFIPQTTTSNESSRRQNIAVCRFVISSFQDVSTSPKHIVDTKNSEAVVAREGRPLLARSAWSRYMQAVSIEGLFQPTSKPPPLTSQSTFRPLARPDMAIAPARRQRFFANDRTSRPAVFVEFDRPDKQALIKEGHAGEETAKGHPQSNFMQHTYTSERQLAIMHTFKKEQLLRRSSGALAASSG